MRNTVPPIRMPMPAISHPMQRVESSAVVEVGYHDAARYLFVTWKQKDSSDGYTYVYPNVPYEEYVNLLTAGSVGTYMTKVIKPRYPAIDINNVDANWPI